METHIKSLETHGFSIIDNVIEEKTVSHVEASLKDLIDDSAVRRRGETTFGIRNLLKVAPSIKSFVNSSSIRKIIGPIAGKKAQVVRAIFFDKTPDVNWKVAWHQDLTIAVRQRKEIKGFNSWTVKAGVPHVQPPVSILENILTMRIHLDEANESNGALNVIVGSHQEGRLNAQRIQELKEHGEIAACYVSRGGALLMRPLLLHSSSAASKPTRRRVIHLEFSASKLPEGLDWYGS